MFEHGGEFASEDMQMVFQAAVLSPEGGRPLEPIVEGGDEDFAPFARGADATLIRLKVTGVEFAFVKYLHQKSVGQGAKRLYEVEHEGGRAELVGVDDGGTASDRVTHNHPVTMPSASRYKNASLVKELLMLGHCLFTLSYATRHSRGWRSCPCRGCRAARGQWKNRGRTSSFRCRGLLQGGCAGLP